MVEVPLRARDGSVRAVALVDEGDAARVLAHRWHLGDDGYARRQVPHSGRKQTAWPLHRFVLGIEPFDPRHVDHEDRNPLNCRRSNLRIATPALNAQNISPAGQRGSSSRYRGVTWVARRGKWQATAHVDGRTHYLGQFEDEHEAGAAAAAFRAAHMPYSPEAQAA